MNSVQPQIASTITYYTTAKEMWEFLRQTYSQDKNVSKILQVEEELHNLRQGSQDLSQYFATVKATYERLKFLRPPCKSCYKSHFEPTMVAKFLVGLFPEYAAAKDQMLTGSEISDLSDAYNKLSRLAISLSQPAGVTPASALAVGSGRGHGSTYSTRGRGIGRGTGGRGRFQCTYCGKIGHLEDRCWDKHGRPSSLPQGRNMVTKQGKSSTYSSMGSAQTATPTVEDSSPSIAPETVSIDRVEGKDALVLFDEMVACGVMPNSATFTAALTSFSHGGLLDEGRGIFSMMRQHYGLESLDPSVEHYACMVDLLGRHELLDKALAFIK
ncbi:Pentatricopeptide repeat-containing protein [Nymphaea thermarum]|nr:Pentatricopeptide repeat-containing protein [Nymphaea thermarum]